MNISGLVSVPGLVSVRGMVKETVTPSHPVCMYIYTDSQCICTPIFTVTVAVHVHV